MRSHLSYANVMATIAVFIALGGSSYAAVKVGSKQIANNTIRSADIRNNSVEGKDVRNGSLTAGDLKAGSLPAGARGATGPQGPQGAPGPQGTPGQTALWALVSQAGSLMRGSHATGARLTVPNSATQPYLVTFDRNVQNCATVATTNSGNYETIATSTTTSGNEVTVGIINRPTGQYLNSPFSLAVFC